VLPTPATLADKIQLNFTDVRQVGNDLRITAALMPR
jgi:hypothetical protein